MRCDMLSTRYIDKFEVDFFRRSFQRESLPDGVSIFINIP